ncbi:hypothetical protein GC177_05260 [bacterium]|nr:hypothetical protein [bacterium]
MSVFRRFIALASTGLLAACAAQTPQAPTHGELIAKARNWVVYYDKALPPGTFNAYDIVVFDDVKHPRPLEVLRNRPRLMLGYVSFGEAGSTRPFPVHEQPGVKLEPNPWWEGNIILDTRQPAWRDFLIKEHIPSILAQGFDGIMIDTVESPLYLAGKDPVKYAGLKQSTVDLIKAVRKAFPGMVIMLNRGFDILPEVAPDIDLLLMESTLVSHDHKTGESKFLSADAHMDYVATFKAAQARNPKLRALTLDYWNPDDTKGVARLYRFQRAMGNVPYVTTSDLGQHHPEPSTP